MCDSYVVSVKLQLGCVQVGITIRKASLRNSSVGGGGLRDSEMRATAGCLERKSLKRGVMLAMVVW